MLMYGRIYPPAPNKIGATNVELRKPVRYTPPHSMDTFYILLHSLVNEAHR